MLRERQISFLLQRYYAECLINSMLRFCLMSFDGNALRG